MEEVKWRRAAKKQATDTSGDASDYSLEGEHASQLSSENLNGVQSKSGFPCRD